MALRDEIQSGYVDRFGLVSPHPIERTAPIAGSNNGVMYTAEYYCLLAKRGEQDALDALNSLAVFAKCQDRPGLLKRSPNNNVDGEAPDDYYGYLNYCAMMRRRRSIYPGVPVKRYAFRHLGFMNNTNPGHIRHGDGSVAWSSFIWRQPQLIAMLYAAAPVTDSAALFLSRLMGANLCLYFGLFHNSALLVTFGLYWLYAVLTRNPFAFAWTRWYAAVVIATSCMFTKTDNQDARRLTWHAIETLTPVSWLTRQAAKVWYRRLYRQYGPDGMREVATRYYSVGHPFARYWV